MPRYRLLAAAALVVTAGVVSTAAEAAPHTSGEVCPTYRANDQYPLRLCDKGDDVMTIQAALRDRGFAIDVDGYFGPQTLSAVRSFQLGRGLEVDGLVGRLTWSALDAYVYGTGSDTDHSGHVEPDELTYVPPSPPGGQCDRYVGDPSYPLNLCDRGPAVRVAQLLLTQIWGPLEIDGYFGPQTELALWKFQSEAGIEVDGLLGPRSWRQITAGFVCGVDDDRSGVIDPDEVALPRDFTEPAELYANCMRS